MSETANIAKMAEMISQEIFDIFMWKKSGPENHDWKCEDASHAVKTHPSDVVFYYDEPYVNFRTYVTCDLKSYAQGTITSANIRSAILSLAKSVSCAEKSTDWQSQYIHPNVTPAVCGMLLVYNHDGLYDRDFQTLLKSVDYTGVKIPKGARVYVLGPEDVFWLHNVAHDITQLRGKKLLPNAEDCSFYYPDLIQQKVIRNLRQTSATLEVLSSPWIMLDDTRGEGKSTGLWMYYRGAGESVGEFSYLIEWLLQFRTIRENSRVQVRTVSSGKSAASFFERAKQVVAESYGGKHSEDLMERLNNIKFSSVNSVTKEFSTIEIGMIR